MIERLGRPWAAAATSAAFVAALAVAATATDAPTSPQYFDPAKLTKQGAPTSSAPGNGTVLVQVLVNADGTFKVQKVVRSSNHALDKAALEMANTSKYSPAHKGGKPVQSFYTYTVKFVGGSSNSSDASTMGELGKYNAQIRAGNYKDAKVGLGTYLDAHPSDAQAATLLGVADTFLDDFPGAVTAFDKVAKILPQYLTVAARAYAGAADKAVAAKDGASALHAAKRAVELSPGAPTYNMLGYAQLVQSDYAGAAQAFEQARSDAATNPRYDNKQKAVIDANLATAYANAGQIDQAAALIPEVAKFDPANTNAEGAVVNYYYSKAADAQKAKDFAAAAGLFDKAAGVGPTNAATMYVNEGYALASIKSKPDWKAVKAAADKALAIKPDAGDANYLAGLALANDNKPKDAIPYLQKADTAAKAANDKALGDRVTDALKAVGASK